MNEEEEDAFEDRRTRREENDEDEIQENIQETRKNKVPTDTIKHRLRKKDDITPPERYGDFKHSSFIAIHDVPSTFEEDSKGRCKRMEISYAGRIRSTQKERNMETCEIPPKCDAE